MTQLRRAGELTQEALARRAGLAPRTIGALERAERAAPQRETVRRISAALGLTANDEHLLLTAARRGAPARETPTRRAPATADVPGAGRRTAPGERGTGIAAHRSTGLPAHAAEALGLALYRTGRFDDALVELEAARRGYRRLADPDGCCRVHGAMGLIFIERGRCDAALTEVLAAPLTETVGAQTRARLALAAARAYELQGAYDDAARHAGAALELAGAAQDQLLIVDANIRVASIRTATGDLLAARGSFGEAAAVAAGQRDSLRAVQAATGLAIVLLRTGPLDEARRHAEEALTGAERIGDVLRAGAAAVHAAAIARESGNVSAAVRYARMASRPGYGEESVRVHHAEVLLALLALDHGSFPRARGLLAPLVDPVSRAADETTRTEATALLIGIDARDGALDAALHRLRGLTERTDPTSLVVPDVAFALVSALLAGRMAHDALALANRFLAASNTTGSTLHRIEALRARTAAYLALGVDAAARSDHRAARQLAAAGGYALRLDLLDRASGRTA
ncbi:helix-turn-helix transcriptional regulator [Micromonospora sp. NPDC050980]|uniref:helix-turn-helix transcriptional regulator n=1 Tax=Micromonospora sp. NPDC050980 TaxID=3155161 RepID=UPI0033C9140D